MSLKNLMLLIPFALAGCVSLDPHYERPSGAVDARTPDGEAYHGLSVSGDYSNLRWQDYILNDQLRQVVTISLQSSRDLREAVASVKAAHAQYGEQRSYLFPTLTAGLSGTRSRAMTGEGNQTALSHSYDAEGSVSAFEIDLFGKNQSLSRASYESWLATLEGARSTRLTVLYNTVYYWLQLAADRSNLSIARQTAESARQSWQITLKQEEHGTASMVDVSSAETVYQSAESDVAAYITSVAQDKNALDLVVGQSVPDKWLPAGIESLGQVMRDIPAGISSKVLENRPDVLQAEHNLKSANANIGAARASFFPEISLTASGGVGSSALHSLFGNGAGIWSFSPSISLPIFSGGYNVSYLKYTRAEKELYIATYEKTVQTAFSEVADALARRGTIGQQLDHQMKNVTASTNYYRLAALRYRHGIDTYLNALTAQRTLYEARTSLVATQQADYVNLITLYKVMGGGSAIQKDILTQ